MGAAGRAGDIVADTGTDGDVFFIALWTNKLQFFQTKQDFLALAIFDVAISLMGIKSHNLPFWKEIVYFHRRFLSYLFYKACLRQRKPVWRPSDYVGL